MSDGTCSISGCPKESRARGWCPAHYQKWRRYGDPLASKTREWCSVDGCGKKHYGNGLCNMHWQRLRNVGSLDTDRPIYQTVEESFAYRTREAENGCIEWTGSTVNGGYGHFRKGGKNHRAHRYAWAQANGPIPEGMVIDHLCHNPACVNVDHLRAVTQAQNTQNLRGPHRGSKSGLRGVYWDSRSDKWYVQVKAGGRVHSGGYFEDKEEAGRVAAEMRARLMPYSQN